MTPLLRRTDWMTSSSSGQSISGQDNGNGGQPSTPSAEPSLPQGEAADGASAALLRVLRLLKATDVFCSTTTADVNPESSGRVIATTSKTNDSDKRSRPSITANGSNSSSTNSATTTAASAITAITTIGSSSSWGNTWGNSPGWSRSYGGWSNNGGWSNSCNNAQLGQLQQRSTAADSSLEDVDAVLYRTGEGRSALVRPRCCFSEDATSIIPSRRGLQVAAAVGATTTGSVTPMPHCWLTDDNTNGLPCYNKNGKGLPPTQYTVRSGSALPGAASVGSHSGDTPHKEAVAAVTATTEGASAGLELPSVLAADGGTDCSCYQSNIFFGDAMASRRTSAGETSRRTSAGRHHEQMRRIHHACLRHGPQRIQHLHRLQPYS